MEKIKNIEFLRFLFAVMIVYAHIMWFLCQVDKLYTDFPAYMKMWNNCGDSFLCVEYFFIISGFFLHFHIKNKKDDTFEFAAKKNNAAVAIVGFFNFSNLDILSV